MNNLTSANSTNLGKLLIRYQLISRAKLEIIKEAKKKSSTWSELNRFVRKIQFKESKIKEQL